MGVHLNTHTNTVAQIINVLKRDLGVEKPEWLSPTETAEYLSMHINTIYRLIKHEELPVHNITVGTTGKNYYRIRRSELEEWLENRRK